MSDLDLGIWASPEIDFNFGPDWRSEVEAELSSSVNDVDRGNCEGIWSDEIKSEALHGWISEMIPMAIAGIFEKVFANW